jgi:hypothetical protein
MLFRNTKFIAGVLLVIAGVGVSLNDFLRIGAFSYVAICLLGAGAVLIWRYWERSNRG